MLEKEQKQIKLPHGQYTAVAHSCNVTPQYVKMVLKGKRNQNTPKAQEIIKKATRINEILND